MDAPSINKLEPAFPINELDQATGGIAAQHFGLTLRDYFAAKAMQAGLAATTLSGRNVSEASTVFYVIADAMLVARAQQPKQDKPS